MNKIILFSFIVIILKIEPTFESIIKNLKPQLSISNVQENFKIINNQTNRITENLISPKSTSISDNFITYIRAAIPNGFLDCLDNFTLLRCLKLYLVQKMESKNLQKSGNLTKDFLDNILDGDSPLISSNWFDKNKFIKISDNELNLRLIKNFERFFKNREIKLHFIPGVLVKVIPNKENKLKLSLHKRKYFKDIITAADEESEEGRRHKNKKKDKNGKQSNHHYMLQVAVPIMLMPAILLGSFLPFIIPAFKMATFMTTIMNNGALLAALMYAARTAAFNNDANEYVHYASPSGGYH